MGGTINRGFAPYKAKSKTGVTYWDVKKKRFGGTKFWTSCLEISMQKYVLDG
jgi:hypothetical protein